MWFNEVQSHAKSVYSQGGQDGIIEWIFQNIGTTNKFCVEFGFNNNSLTSGSGANVANLVVNQGWNALLLDCDNENPTINLHKEFLTPQNIAFTFHKYNVPDAPDFVSIDVDSIDLWLMLAMLNGGYRPRLISVEYNANFSLEVSATVKEGTTWQNGDGVYGASLLALCRAADKFGYILVGAVKQLDLFFLNKNATQIDTSPLTDWSDFVGISTHNEYGPPTAERLAQFVEYPTMEPLKNHPWL